MSDIKISQLPEVTGLSTSDIGPVVASGVTSKITIQNLAGALPQVSSSISSSYAVSASYVLSSSYAVSSSYALSASYAINSVNAQNAVSATYAATASSADNFVVRQDITGANALFSGTITAQKLVVQVITSSVVYSSGSNTFGNQLTDIQQFTGSVRITGSLIMNGPAQFNSEVVMNNLTGSLFGTASWSRNAITASYVTGSVFNSSNPALSASYAVSTSYALNTTNATNAISASYALSASYARAALSASFAISSSYAAVADFVTSSKVFGPYGFDSVLSASWASTASFASTASYSVNSVSASYAQTATTASYSITSVSASYAESANTASYVATSSWSNNSTTASYAITASYAVNAGAGAGFPFSGSAVITGSLLITNLSGSGNRIMIATETGFITASGIPFSGSIGYVHSQSSAASTWSITHNLDTLYPIVTVFSPANTVVIPNSITISGLNTLDVSFTSPIAGIASVVDPTTTYTGAVFEDAPVYKFDQPTAASTWTINHNLNSSSPIVTVYDGASKVMIPQDIIATTANQISITFATPESGSASIIGNLAFISGSSALSASNAISASYAISASSAISASYALTASFIPTASWARNAVTASYALTASYLNPIATSYVVLTQVSQSLNYVDDTAAAAGGVPLGGLYRNGNFILIRIT